MSLMAKTTPRAVYERGTVMHSFKALETEEIRAILDSKDEEGNPLYPDVLTPLAKKEEELFKSSPCPKCGVYSSTPILDSRRPFIPSSPLPNRILRCVICSTEFDPRTGLITLANITDVPG
jgi:hypothetical protein